MITATDAAMLQDGVDDRRGGDAATRAVEARRPSELDARCGRHAAADMLPSEPTQRTGLLCSRPAAADMLPIGPALRCDARRDSHAAAGCGNGVAESNDGGEAAGVAADEPLAVVTMMGSRWTQSLFRRLPQTSAVTPRRRGRRPSPPRDRGRGCELAQRNGGGGSEGGGSEGGGGDGSGWRRGPSPSPSHSTTPPTSRSARRVVVKTALLRRRPARLSAGGGSAKPRPFPTADGCRAAVRARRAAQGAEAAA